MTVLLPPVPKQVHRSRLVAQAITFARVPVGVVMLAGIIIDRSFAALLVVVFVFLDIVDGMVARACDVDDESRRMADGLIDRTFSCPPIILAAAMFAPWATIPAVGIFARESVIGVGNLRALRSKGIVYSAPATHKITSLGYAAAGLALLLSPPAGALAVTSAACLVSVSLTPLYLAQRRAAVG